MAHDVFISHSAKDKTTADAVCAVLESQGIRCWVAPRDVLPGADWGASIIKAIKGARVMVLIFSTNANNSKQIKLEVERAVNKGIPIIPLRIEDTAPTEALELFLGLQHWLDAFTPPLERHLQHLARVIAQTLEVPLPEVPPARPIKPKAEWLAWVGVFAILISAASVWYFVKVNSARRNIIQPPLIRAAQLKTIKTIPFDSNLGNIAVNPALNKIYVSGEDPNNSIKRIFVMDGNTFTHTIIGKGNTVGVDVKSNNYWTTGVYSGEATVWNSTDSLLTNISLGYCPGAVSVDAPNRVVWIAAQCGADNDPIWAINADTFAIIAGPIGSGGVQGQIQVNPVTDRLYINPGFNGVSVSKRVDPHTFAVTTNSFGAVICVNELANLLYAQSSSTNLQIINGAPDPEEVQANIALPFSFFGGAIGVDTVLSRIYIGSNVNNTLAILDATTGQSIGNVSLDPEITAIWSLAVDASRQRIYVLAHSIKHDFLIVLQETPSSASKDNAN